MSKKLCVEVVVSDNIDITIEEMKEYLKKHSDEDVQFNVVDNLTRVEVIEVDNGGRAYVKWKPVIIDFQDDRRTLKVFVY